jgi:diamine N-acetyltransferase
MELNIRLRAPEPDDLDLLYRWENDPEQWKNSLNPAIVSRHALWNFLQSYDDNIFANGQARFMIDVIENNVAVTVGTIDLCDFCGRDRRAFVSIFIDTPNRSYGYGHNALSQVINIARQSYNIEQLAAIIAADNTASLRLFTDAGFTQSGLMRNWLARGKARIDAVLLQLQL